MEETGDPTEDPFASARSGSSPTKKDVDPATVYQMKFEPFAVSGASVHCCSSVDHVSRDVLATQFWVRRGWVVRRGDINCECPRLYGAIWHTRFVARAKCANPIDAGFVRGGAILSNGAENFDEVRVVPKAHIGWGDLPVGSVDAREQCVKPAYFEQSMPQFQEGGSLSPAALRAQ
eukprot:388188-Pyramimonas_sp.AAC.1